MGDVGLFIGMDDVEYCDFYKPLVVEEISLCESPYLLHYGKCSVIGRVSRNGTGLFQLNNIKLHSIEKEYQIPSNTTSIILLDTLNIGKIPVGAVCEVCGEVVLYDNSHSENILPKTAMDLVREISYLSSADVDINAVLANMKSRYLPAIRIHTFNIVDQPSEVIECNLTIRCLKAKRKR